MKRPPPKPLSTRAFVLADGASRPSWKALRDAVVGAVAAGTRARTSETTWGPGDAWTAAALVLSQDGESAVLVGALLEWTGLGAAPGETSDGAPCVPCVHLRTLERGEAGPAAALVDGVAAALGSLGFQEGAGDALGWRDNARTAVDAIAVE